MARGNQSEAPRRCTEDLDEIAETEAGREIFRGGLREADYYRRLNEIRDERAEIEAKAREETKDGWLTKRERKLAYVKKNKGEVIAISADCTPLGRIVSWDEDQKIFKCPCHDGRYDADGKVISGPPPAPLKRHKTKIEGGKILVATETIPYGGDKSV